MEENETEGSAHKVKKGFGNGGLARRNVEFYEGRDIIDEGLTLCLP